MLLLAYGITLKSKNDIALICCLDTIAHQTEYHIQISGHMFTMAIQTIC